MKITEFYPEKQGRPYSPPSVSLDGRGFGLAPYSVRGIHLAGEFSKTSKTDDYTAGDEMVILVDASGGTITITLPPAAINSSKVYYIKKIDSTGNSVTIQGNDANETIDGEESVALTLQYQYVTIICDALDWYIIGGEYVKIEDILSRKLGEQIELLRKLLTEAQQTTLHMASQSDENIGEKDAQ